MIDATKPEVLVYDENKQGRLKLAAVEYVIFESAWTGSGKPTLFGQEFDYVPAGNRYGLPAFYALHAWIWKGNPSGMLYAWNPKSRLHVSERSTPRPGPRAPVAASCSPNFARADELPDARLADDLAALHDHVAAQEHRLDVADDLGALVEVVVRPRLLVRGGDRVRASRGRRSTMSASEPTAIVPLRG